MVNNQNNMLNMFQQFKNNPIQYMLSRKFNIPQNIANDPQAIIQHLLDSGQMSQQQFNYYRNIIYNNSR